MQRIPFGSPSKQNQSSPMKKGKNHAYQELVGFIKSSGVKVPPAILKIISSGGTCQSPLKQAQTNREGDDSKKLKIQLTDVQFQYKKLEEDFAEYKRSVKAEKQRQFKKNEDAISKLKTALQFSNEDGLYSIAKLKQQHQEQLTNLKDKSRLELEQEKTNLINQYETKISNMEKLHTRQIAELKKEHQKVFSEKVKGMEEQLKETKIQHRREVKEAALKNKQILQERDKRYESIRVAIESEKKTEEKLHEKTKIEAAKAKEKLLSELCFQKNVKVHLEQTIESLERQIRSLKNIINDKETQIILLQEKSTRKLQKNELDYNQKIKQLQKQQDEAIQQTNQTYTAELDKFEMRIQKMQQLAQEKEEMMASNYEDLTSMFEKRPSKKEDISEIEKMKWALTRREEQIRKLNKDLKYCNLELENKEDLYTRIFRGNSMSRDKKPREKEEKEVNLIDQKLGKDLVCRRSQTSDIKFLLKVYNNNKFQ